MPAAMSGLVLAAAAAPMSVCREHEHYNMDHVSDVRASTICRLAASAAPVRTVTLLG